ncbi:hypothetical protein R1flu_012881 [Riccia fluitans]|uniref:DNA ligase n=1 Tax=Riccia fluitans TaxID=41844 RepID=A0ABD1ZD28_9MARC
MAPGELGGLVESGTLIIDSLSLYREAIQSLKRASEHSEFVERIDTQLSEPVGGAANGGQITLDLANVPTESLANFPSSFPTVKRIPNTQFVVDGFRNAGPWSISYFLSHFHSDHYAGITNLWSKGLIFCSEITARLLKHSLQVTDVLVVPLPMGKPVIIDGCEVVLVDANHCPGAVQFLFRVPGEAGDFLRYVHCGDMRYHPFMKSEPSLCDFMGADAMFLDTTYCNPRYVFPSQQESVDYVAETVERLMEADSAVGLETPLLQEENDSTMEDREDVQEEEMEDMEGLQKSTCAGDGPSKKEVIADEEDETVFSASDPVEGKSTLFLISTYVIGKEKILTAVAKRCNCLIYVTEKKLSVLKCLNLENFEVFTTDPSATNVHVLQWNFLGETWPYFRPNFLQMEKAMKERGYKKVVGFVPTGWTYELKKKTFSVRKKGPCEIHLVPYSEHSNYQELREYVGVIRPKQIIPTVGLDGGGMDSKVVADMRKHFRNLVDETASKKNFLRGFHRKPQEENSAALKKSGDEEAVPKAIFGLAARKRKRDCDEGPDDVVDDLQPTQDASPMQIEFEDKGKAVQGLDLPALAEKEETSEKRELSLAPSTSTGIADSVDAGKSGWVDSVAQNADRNGVPLHSTSSSGPEKKPGNVTNGQTTRARTSTPLSSPGPKSRASTGRQPKAQARQTKPPVSRKARKTGVSAPVSRKAVQSPKSSLRPKHFQRAKQVSLFSFFKKAGEEAVSTTVVSTLDTERLMILSGKSAQEELQKPRASRVQNDVDKWADEYEQLASLLDGNLSRESAHDLLEKAGGDVGVALDLFYSGESGIEPEEAPEDDVGVSESGTPENGVEEKLPSANKQVADAGTLDNKNVRADVSCRPQNTVDEEHVHSGKVDEVAVKISELNSQDDRVEEKPVFGTGKQDVHTPRSSSTPTHAKAAVPKPEPSMRKSEMGIPGTRNANSVREVNVNHGIVISKPPPTQGGGAEPASYQVKKDTFSSVKQEKPEERKKDRAEKKGGSVALPVGKYSPVEHACWEPGEPAPYIHLARAFDLVEQESGRLRTADMLCNMFRSLLALSPDDVLPAVYLTTNRLAPDFESVDLNIGGSTVSTAVGEVAGVSRAKLREMYAAMGDLGDVAQACRQTQSILRLPPALRIGKVFSTLKQISKESGAGSGARKKDLVLNLLRACREKEMKYIVRTLVQNLRIGAMMKTILGALAQAVVLHHSFPANEAPANEELVKLKPKFQEAALAVVEAYNFLPNLDLLVPTLVNEGVAALTANISISPGTPIKPMLAKITNGIPDLLKRFEGQSFTCEYKYDGQRAQIHMLADGTFRIFSRNCEDTTGRFPDVADICRVAAREDLKSFIIDAEIVAVNRDNGNKLMAFQHLSTRERGSRDGTSIKQENIKVSVCVFVFDLLYANEEPLVKMSFRERRKSMHQWFPNIKPGHFGYATEISIEPEDTLENSISQKVEGFLEEAFAASCEGLMAKALDVDSNYMASKRTDSWLKIKRDYLEGLNDSLDLVPIGAWYGNGRKAGWYSPFLLACYDPEREEYQSVCRVMSGFTDVFYKEMKEFYSGDRILPRKPTYYQTGEECSVWFTPELVWEIRGADFTVSPVHLAAVGHVHPSRGVSMRFPRYIRSRPDKNPENASTPSEIAELFHQQTRKLDVGGSGSSKPVDTSGSPEDS